MADDTITTDKVNEYECTDCGETVHVAGSIRKQIPCPECDGEAELVTS